MSESLSGVHFTNLLNKITLTVESLQTSEEDKLRMQILLIHVYADYLMIKILKESLIDYREMAAKAAGFSSRLHVLSAKTILDSNAFHVIKILNSIRNDFAHEYELNLDSIRERIANMEQYLQDAAKAQFQQANNIGKVLIGCAPFLNSLRQYLLKHDQHDEEGIIGVNVNDEGVVRYFWLGHQKTPHR